MKGWTPLLVLGGAGLLAYALSRKSEKASTGEFQPSTGSDLGSVDMDMGWAWNYPITTLITTGTGLPNFPINPFTINRLSAVSDFLGRLPWPRSKVTVSSGYRGWLVNKAVGGAKKSRHMTGEAVDFSVAGLTNRQVAAFLWLNQDKIKDLDQVIVYTDSGHTHVTIGGDGKAFMIGSKASGDYDPWSPSESDKAAVRHLKMGWDWRWPKRIVGVGLIGGFLLWQNPQWSEKWRF